MTEEERVQIIREHDERMAGDRRQWVGSAFWILTAACVFAMFFFGLALIFLR